LTFGQLTTIKAPLAGTLSRLALTSIGFGRHFFGRVGVQGFVPNRRDPALFDEELDGLQRLARKWRAHEFFGVLLKIPGHVGSERREGAARHAAFCSSPARRSLSEKRKSLTSSPKDDEKNIRVTARPIYRKPH
jgi:hypothetical protein